MRRAWEHLTRTCVPRRSGRAIDGATRDHQACAFACQALDHAPRVCTVIKTMDTDGNGEIDVDEWLANLNKCAGLAARLAAGVNTDGEIAGFELRTSSAEEVATPRL